jgi:hypothetical protein
MVDAPAPGPLSDIHVADWTVVHVRQDLDAATVHVLSEHLVPLLTRHARIAVDLRRSGVTPEAAAAVRTLSDAATATGARLVVVEPRADARAALLLVGVPHVHESLDAAVHDLAPVNTHEVPGAPATAELAPASSDATLVAAEDVSGTGPGA